MNDIADENFECGSDYWELVYARAINCTETQSKVREKTSPQFPTNYFEDGD